MHCRTVLVLLLAACLSLSIINVNAATLPHQRVKRFGFGFMPMWGVQSSSSYSASSSVSMSNSYSAFYFGRKK
uniref:Secreted protein n=1 Tax=Steinernema glaseri TaxID=37863 RepID=A0A1I7YKK1_9BILA